MIKYLKQNIVILIAIIILISLGTLSILVDGSDILLVFSIIGLLYLTIIGSWLIYSAFKYKAHLEENHDFLNRPIGYIIQGIILISFGVLMIIFHNFLVRLIIGILLIIIPLIILIKENNKKQYLKRNYWKFIVGLFFILAFDEAFSILFLIIGIGLFLLAIYLIYLLIINYKDKTNANILTKYVIAYIVRKNNKDIGE